MSKANLVQRWSKKFSTPRDRVVKNSQVPEFYLKEYARLKLVYLDLMNAGQTNKALLTLRDAAVQYRIYQEKLAISNRE